MVNNERKLNENFWENRFNVCYSIMNKIGARFRHF